MPKIKSVAYTTTFNQLNEESHSMGETNDCGVKAVALVANVSYNTAHAALAARGRKNGKGTMTADIHRALIIDFNVKIEQVNAREIIATYPMPHCEKATCLTTHHPRRFAKAWPKGKFLLYTKRHVAAVIDGELHDWTVNTAKRVTHIYKVETNA
jgi:hypothetical protein